MSLDSRSRDGPKSKIKENTKRFTVQFSGTDLDNLEWLTKEQGINMTEAIRKALNTDAFLRKTIKKGSEVLIKESPEDIYKLLIH